MSHRDDHDDLDPTPVPDPDVEPTANERARGRAFGDLVDKVIAGRPPAAMSAEDRALVEMATVIRAGAGRLELAPARSAALIEDVLRGALDRGGWEPANQDRGRPGAVAATPELSAKRARRRERLGGRAPWFVAAVSSAVAAAAVIALIARPAPPEPATPPTARASMPEHLRSRPADPLIGAIPQLREPGAAVRAASSRIDVIYADRLDAYRTLSMGGR